MLRSCEVHFPAFLTASGHLWGWRTCLGTQTPCSSPSWLIGAGGWGKQGQMQGRGAPIKGRDAKMSPCGPAVAKTGLLRAQADPEPEGPLLSNGRAVSRSCRAPSRADFTNYGFVQTESETSQPDV